MLLYDCFYFSWAYFSDGLLSCLLSPESTYVYASFAKFACSRFCFVILCIWYLQINWIGLDWVPLIGEGVKLERVLKSCDVTENNMRLYLIRGRHKLKSTEL